MNISVAIDGPVGAGKSTIAKECAKRLGFIYVDTGAMYRAIGLYCVKNGIDTADENGVTKALDNIKLQIKLIGGAQHVILNNEDVSEEIRLPEISLAASAASKIGAVRGFLLDMQRSFADKNNVIMDGRDIGTVVLPSANVKIFLTAKPEIRARRRYDELCAKGMEVRYEDILKDLNQRDYTDSHREIAPLKQADDAVLADTSEVDFEGSVQLILDIINKKK